SAKRTGWHHPPARFSSSTTDLSVRTLAFRRSGISPVPFLDPTFPFGVLCSPQGMLRRSSSQKRTKRSSQPRRKRTPSYSAGRKAACECLEELGIRLREARVRRGLTQNQLASKCELSSRFIAKVETGGGNISVSRLRELAGALEVPIESITAENAPASPAF